MQTNTKSVKKSILKKVEVAANTENSILSMEEHLETLPEKSEMTEFGRYYAIEAGCSRADPRSPTWNDDRRKFVAQALGIPESEYSLEDLENDLEWHKEVRKYGF